MLGSDGISSKRSPRVTRGQHQLLGGAFIPTTERQYYRDADIYIHSGADGEIDIVADSAVRLGATSIYLNEYLIHEGDVDTYIRFADNLIQLVTGSINVISQNATGLGFFSVTPQAQQAHIADPTDLATCIAVLTTLLADLEGYGLLST